MNYIYLVAISDLNRILLYQFSDKHKEYAGEWSLPFGVTTAEPSAAELKKCISTLFNGQLKDAKLLETLSDDQGNEHFFFAAELSSDVELNDKKSDYGYYTFQQLHYFNLPKIQKELLGSVFASSNN